jgi:hypothetical protein
MVSDVPAHVVVPVARRERPGELRVQQRLHILQPATGKHKDFRVHLLSRPVGMQDDSPIDPALVGL